MEDYSQFRANLLAWFAGAKREMPWRETQDPYLIWLSEVILQQTRVEQGLPYYLRYAEKYPIIVEFANAADDEILKLWQGLGYYSRARNMLHAARQVRDDFGGEFPKEYAAIRKLKGVGDYTAAAIASIAFGLPHAVVDGNVLRVLSRYFADSTPIDSGAGKKLYANLAQNLLDTKKPAAFNQAMMELGSLICKPRQPLCHECPIAFNCLGKAKGLQESLPIKAGKTKIRIRHFHYLVFDNAGKTLLKKRGSGDIWQGLYEFPLLEGEFSESEILTQIETYAGPKFQLNKVSKLYKHILSHQHLIAQFYEIDTEMANTPTHFEWVDWSVYENYPVSRLMEKWWEGKG